MISRMKTKQNKTSTERVHQVIGRVSISGEESIAAATLSRDGQLLAVSSVSSTRLFRLVPSTGNGPKSIKIKKIKLDTELPGASSLQISADQKWLSVISYKNDVLLFRLSRSEDTISVPPKPLKLARVKRGVDTSSLQSYRRAISRQQFSPDSKVLVVSDLSGFVDCWSLQGEEDLSALDVEMKDEDASDDSDDDEETEDETRSHGQYWKNMESSKTMPQLDSAAIILSFRPSKLQTFQPNGVSHEQANGGMHEEDTSTNDKYNLFILTATHQLHEFSLTTGKLTDWSRRNSSDRLPETFRRIKDRAMGCLWHTKDDAQRLYLYGSNWLCFFDVARDFEVEETKKESNEGLLEGVSKKRKWAGESGAGDKMRDKDFQGFKPGVTITQDGVPVEKKTKTEQAVEKQRIIKAAEDEEDDDEESEEEEQDVIASRALRVKKGEKEGEGPRRTWHSFSYRPILVVVPMEEEDEFVEAVLVERPTWELKLPERLVGPHESKSL
jgi:U3 small nucleolar RNA-associated protein 4